MHCAELHNSVLGFTVLLFCSIVQCLLGGPEASPSSKGNRTSVHVLFKSRCRESRWTRAGLPGDHNGLRGLEGHSGKGGAAQSSLYPKGASGLHSCEKRGNSAYILYVQHSTISVQCTPIHKTHILHTYSHIKRELTHIFKPSKNPHWTPLSSHPLLCSFLSSFTDHTWPLYSLPLTLFRFSPTPSSCSSSG